MYNDYFGLREAPFSIAPNPQYLFMSPRHREALAHLLYGIQSDGGFILLTGEVGTGKTTVCRCLLEQIPDEVDTAYILNPKQTAAELLATACDELHIDYPDGASIKVLVDQINRFLLDSHQNGRRTVLIIDEAQNLSVDVLEQLRLLTNLETNQRKLLQIILLGQPELLTLLAKQELRQLSQRVTARFHLDALNRDEVSDYIQHRLDTAGAKGALFTPPAVKRIFNISKGIPRLINLVCDRALLGTYVQNRLQVNVATVNDAAREVLGQTTSDKTLYFAVAAALVLSIAVGSVWMQTPNDTPAPANASSAQSNENANGIVEPQEVFQSTAQQSHTPVNLSSLTPKRTVPISDAVGFSTEGDAYRALMLAWGSEVVLAENADPCDVAKVSGLLCLSNLGSLRDVAHLNRPVIITLPTNDGSQYFLVTHVDDNTVTVSGGGDEILLDQTEVLATWDGYFSLLWRAPPAYQKPAKKGDRGAAVDWLMTQLAIIEGTPIPSITESRSFDEDLESRIKRFQISVGLAPNGIVGPQTWIHLNSADASGIPVLKVNKGSNG